MACDMDVELEREKKHVPFPLHGVNEKTSTLHRMVCGRSHAVVDDLGPVAQRLVEALVDDGLEEVFLALEVRIHRALGEASLFSDLVERGGDVAPPGEHRRGGRDELGAGARLL